MSIFNSRNYFFLYFLFILQIVSCHSAPEYKEQPSQQGFIDQTKKMMQLRDKYHLKEAHFETDQIHSKTDFLNLLQPIVNQLLPEKTIIVTVDVSPDSLNYIATLSNKDTSMQLTASTKSPVLPDRFFSAFESIPITFKAVSRFYSVNPVIGITAQDAWYFSAEESVLLQAKKEGMPLIGPNENPFESNDFKKLKEQMKSN